ncbi:diguanylate cyclase (GGDEF)-like protein [Kibdelosporangium banguiense]|uniref:Diguanylate cyclase (GGDEF)-like protein n=1 Tax=Kibdelosporangium banguiense TaxID=1365924 RepID=A0ABS4TL65_9PSEU|nr:GGDEF domain-containing protein [Kibdelosporangium banguiense]MBP2325172.1 diguanylate cyclase (GGDEF)-like protein [Kibdelosporangium banguiense]
MSNSPSCDSCGRPHGAWATDRLTLLLDRWGWDAQAQEILAASQSTALVIVDLDNFKRVNDRYGHVAGDAVLKAVADTLRHSTRKGDLLGRYGGHGGDEFLVLLPETDMHDAMIVADRIRQDIRATVVPAPTDGGTVRINRVTASFGVSVGNPGTDLEALVVEADAALRHAKRTGRDRVRAPSRRSMRMPAAILAAGAAVGLIVVSLVGDTPRVEQVAAEPSTELGIAPQLPTVTLPPVTVPTTVTMTATVPPPKPQAPVVRQQPKRPAQTPGAPTAPASEEQQPTPRELEKPSPTPAPCRVCDLMDAAISDYMRFLPTR